MACKTHRNWLICNSMKKCAYLNIVGIKYFYGIFLEPGRYNVFLCACCSIPSTAGTASTHVRLQENASLSKFSPVHICIEKLNATRGPYEACLLKPRSPPLPSSLPRCYHTGVNDGASKETYYSLYGLCLGVHSPCCLAPQKRVVLQRKGPLYGHHSTRLKTPNREAGREREGETEGDGHKKVEVVH